MGIDQAVITKVVQCMETELNEAMRLARAELLRDDELLSSQLGEVAARGDSLSSEALSWASLAIDLLTNAGAHFRLGGDVALFRRRLGTWAESRLSTLERVARSIDAGVIDAGSSGPFKFPVEAAIFPLLCVLLARNAEQLGAFLSAVRVERLHPVKAYPKPARAKAILLNDMLVLLDRRPELISSVELLELSERDTKGEFRDYLQMTGTIASGDAEGFREHLARCENAFRERRNSHRESGLNLFGHGVVGNLAAVDVVGLAMCRVALEYGIEPSVDSEIYPAVLYQ